MNPSSNLGPRLDAIFTLVSKAQQNVLYRNIWDCCCDHGYLGIKILSEKLCEKLIFVDQIPHIIEQLALKLAPYTGADLELITADAGELSFSSKLRHLVILAGVGGEKTVQIVSSIEKNNPGVEIDYIFCPSTSQAALREYLVAEKFALLQESLVYENRRYYEILYVRNTCLDHALPAVSLSCDLWDANDDRQQQYLSKLARHEKHKKLGEILK